MEASNSFRCWRIWFDSPEMVVPPACALRFVRPRTTATVAAAAKIAGAKPAFEDGAGAGDF